MCYKASGAVLSQVLFDISIDFVKCGFGFFILSMLLLWIVGFLVIYPIVGFPEGILEQATKVLETAAR